MTEIPRGSSATPPPVPETGAASAAESAADRVARIKAQRAADMSATTPAAPSPAPKRAPAGRASRYLAAGGAVGVGMVMVGGMAAAADQPAADAPTLAPVQRIMVVPQAAQPPTQIVVVLPDTSGAVATSALDLGQVPAVAPVPAVPAEPQPAAPERPAPTKPAEAESHGS